MITKEAWTEWFVAVGDEESLRTWQAALETFTNPSQLDAWATIIELNRLSRLHPIKREHPPEELAGAR